MSLLLASAVALYNNTLLEDTGEMTDYYPPSLKAPYPAVTFTTPPDIPLAREYAPYERQYGVPAEEYGPPAREYGTPAREYGPPAREYDTPARDYGAPIRSSYHRHPPSLARDIPPVAEYSPPTGFGVYPPPEAYPSTGVFPPSGGFPPPGAFPPTGGIPPPGAFPPTGGFPPPGAAFLPPGGYPPYGVSGDELKTRLYILFEPVAVLVVGVAIFVVVRHYVLPYLIYWARSLEEEELELEDEMRSLRDPVTLNILKAVTRGVCLSRISCQLGMMAHNYTITDLAIR